ncbi:hypothetical protein [Actinoplanes sp. HUAS TT8]|uniref:hypothetical protein n=1 Tax=Actinoplanes sp. HUAS TT8 TaxID=3447453 RepID=UPI003F51F27C
MRSLRTTLFAGATVTAMAAAPVAFAAPVQAATAAYDREVTFTVDGTLTYGTIHVPAHPAGRRLPAALLLPGSGPTDRNGDQPPAATPHTLAQLADTLGDDGVMTFRFDKYATGRTGLGAFAAHPDRLDYPAFVRQAAAAYRLLAATPQADPRRLLVVGHSEGGLTALELGTSVKPRPAGLALITPQSLRLLDTIAMQLRDQYDAAVAAGQLTAAQRDADLAVIAAAIADIRASRPVVVTGLPAGVAQLLQALQSPANARFVLTDDAVVPAVVARRVPTGTDVLVTCGSADIQVPCATTDAVTAALRAARTSGPGRVVLAGVDHLQHDPAHPDTLAPALQQALRRWLAAIRH